MTTRFKTFATLSILAFAVTANGQFSKKVSVTGIAQGAGGQAAAEAPASPAEVLRALQAMNEAAGDHLAASKRRIAQMTQFLKSKDMLDAYQATDSPPKMLPQAMGFQEALDVAIQHDAANGPVDSSADPAMVQREVTAYTDMVRTVWNQYQEAMVTVQRMTDFMNSNDVFNDYMSWANDLKESDRQAMLDAAHKRAEADRIKQAEDHKEAVEALNKDWAAYHKHHQEMLNTAWQHYKFNSKMRLQYYKYSKEYQHGSWNNYGDPYGDVY